MGVDWNDRQPIYRQIRDRVVAMILDGTMLVEGADREQLAALGDVRTPSIADLFVAVVGAAR